MRWAASSFLGAVAVLSVACGTERRTSVAPQPQPPATENPAPEVVTGRLRLLESWPSETSLDQPDIADASQLWPAMIDATRKRLDIAQMYISDSPGSALHRVLSSVERAAERGVRVRILVDSRFAPKYPAEIERLRSRSGVQLVEFDAESVFGRGVLHAKYFVMDDESAYLGSQNFDWRSLEHVQELGVYFDESSLVRALSDVFEYDWALAQGRAAPHASEYGFPVRTSFRGEVVWATPVFSPRGHLPNEQSWDLPQLLDLIDGAKDRIRVQVMSYTTRNYDGTRNTELDDALRAAAHRGVEVELLVAHWNTSANKVKSIQSLEEVPHVSVRIVTIPEHSRGFIPFARVVHSKYLVVDGQRAWVGTSNWSGDYFYGSRNVGLVVDGAAFAARLDDLFATLWQSEYTTPCFPEREYPEPRIAE